MSWVTLSPPHGRPGQLACVCDSAPPAAAGVAVGPTPGVAAAAGPFALTVFAQALTTTTLPLAGAVLAPKAAWGALPYALFFVGAALATLPAAILTDRFGRRAALALGASLGLAGGVIAARNVASGHFAGLALGALWLGVAQGFGFFYRHAPIARAADGARAIAAILGSGALAAALAPAAISLARASFGPLAPAAVLLLAGAAEVGVLILTLNSAAAIPVALASPPQPIQILRFLGATLAAGGAWFGMALLMASAAPAMALCGVGYATTSAVIANHFLWMYAPAAIARRWLRRLGGAWVAGCGLTLVLCAVLAFWRQTGAFEFAALMAAAGFGWSLAMFGASMLLHEKGAPSAPWLALHDAAFFSAGVAGALAATAAV